MAKKTVGAEAAKLAGLQVDSLTKFRDGQLTLDQWEWFNNLSRETRDQLMTGKVEIVQAKCVLPDIDQQLDSWKGFWDQVAGTKINIHNVKIPDHQPGFDQLIFMPEEVKMTNNSIFDLCNRHFEKPYWKYYDNLDREITYHDRNPNNGSYAILVRDREEADEENKDLPPRHFWDEEPDGAPRLSKICTETYLERMVHGLHYFKRASRHLDRKFITLCPASRYRYGRSPHVDFDPSDGKVYVLCCAPDNHSPGWRARSAVSLPVEPRESAA